MSTITSRRFFCRLYCYTRLSSGCYGQPQSSHSAAPTFNAHRTRGVSNYGVRKIKPVGQEVEWKTRSDVLAPDRAAEFAEYGTATAEDLRNRKRRPKRIKMLTRDFIDDSLYNAHYGYFSKQAVIFSPGQAFDFREMGNEADFYGALGARYKTFEDDLDLIQTNDARQLWHTPTELFRPHYAEAIARYLVTNYRISGFPHHDLIIYELGAGNGTFMLNVLDYIRDYDTEVYARTKYKIIEISSTLAGLQAGRLQESPESGRHGAKVEIINQSIFAWKLYVPGPCFVLAMEVIDNFAHDVVRYSPQNEQPLQGMVLVDANGEFFEFFTPDLDPVAARFFRVRDIACDVPLTHPLRWSRWLRYARAKLPLAPNLSEPEYIPTRLMQFFDILRTYFPAHKLVISDFNSLPHSIAGINAPVVQTRYQRRTVTVTTPLVRQGYFDIMFPTDFAITESLYRAMTGKFTRVLTHEDFLRRWAYVEETTTKSGENPMLSWYKNASVMITV